MVRLTQVQARRFLLLKHGLLGEHRFAGKQGALDFIRQAGCIQFDPVDACGKNAELVLQSRVKGFQKDDLYQLLYVDRRLMDYPDKNLSIFPVEDWPYFERYRAAARLHGESYPQMQALTRQVRAALEKSGPLCSDDLSLDGAFFWQSAIHWSGGTNLARSVLEQMYSTGDLVIHHKKGTRKYYDLAERHLPAELLRAPDPLSEEAEHQKWRVLRRIGAVGLLWNRPSDAWLNIWGLKGAQRCAAFDALLSEGSILEVGVDGLLPPLYCRAEDEALLKTVLTDEPHKPRCELIAPLDCLLWDRRLIRSLFGFDYTWEIYTPAEKRKYGFYVLPLLFGERFVGRVEAAADRRSQTLVVKNVWVEDGVRRTKKLASALEGCLKRFSRFNGCVKVVDAREI